MLMKTEIMIACLHTHLFLPQVHSCQNSFYMHWLIGRYLLVSRFKMISNEPLHENTNKLGFRPGPTQTNLYNHRRKLEA